ncbi:MULTISPECIES: guanylate kinase [Ahrensia]|uniref:guanylate kinase n=1 Tax=Ahrensia TaxID=152180 RepID=UPI00037D70FB|nr:MULTISPECIES: guanylate kinase [Ahrensia]
MSDSSETMILEDGIARRGLMLVLSSPSGAGKSSIARNLLADGSGIELSVSVTTRARRASEIDGRHYHFISERQFLKMRENDDLLEWAEVHGNFYGTPREPVEQAMREGRDMLFDIDWQGAEQLGGKMRSDVVSVFVLPPSMAELKDRLHRRAEDDEAVIEKRLVNAAAEIEHWRDYDFVIVNHDLAKAYGEVRSIVVAERLRRTRRPGMYDFITTLIGN